MHFNIKLISTSLLIVKSVFGYIDQPCIADDYGEGVCVKKSSCTLYGSQRGSAIPYVGYAPDWPCPNDPADVICCVKKVYNLRNGSNLDTTGECLNISHCNGDTINTYECPGSDNVKLCVPTTEIKNPPDNSNLAAAAVAYSWETKEMGIGNDGTELYRAVRMAVYPDDTIFQSCDRGIAAAVAWSGADDDFPVGNTASQDSYLQKASMNTDLWIMIGEYDDHYSELQPGDILITTAKRRSEIRGKKTNFGHIVMYVGNEEIRKKYPNSDAEFVSASYEERSPGCGDHPKDYIGDGYYLYRYVGDYSGMKKYYYNGYGSGTSY